MGFTYIWNLQGHEWDWVELVAKGQCVFDIGANLGQSTLHLANAVGPSGTVVALEPVRDNFDRLVQNIELNRLNQVTPVCAAASNADGIAEFEFDCRRPSVGRLNSSNSDGLLAGADRVHVRQLTLDSYKSQGWPTPSFLKVDVEGGASGVFEGARDVLNSCRPVVYVELHSGDEQRAVREFLLQHNYHAFLWQMRELRIRQAKWSTR